VLEAYIDSSTLVERKATGKEMGGKMYARRGKKNKTTNGKQGYRRGLRKRKRVRKIQWLVSQNIVELSIKENDAN